MKCLLSTKSAMQVASTLLKKRAPKPLRGPSLAVVTANRKYNAGSAMRSPPRMSPTHAPTNARNRALLGLALLAISTENRSSPAPAHFVTLPITHARHCGRSTSAGMPMSTMPHVDESSRRVNADAAGALTSAPFLFQDERVQCDPSCTRPDQALHSDGVIQRLLQSQHADNFCKHQTNHPLAPPSSARAAAKSGADVRRRDPAIVLRGSRKHRGPPRNKITSETIRQKVLASRAGPGAYYRSQKQICTAWEAAKQQGAKEAAMIGGIPPSTASCTFVHNKLPGGMLLPGRTVEVISADLDEPPTAYLRPVFRVRNSH